MTMFLISLRNYKQCQETFWGSDPSTYITHLSLSCDCQWTACAFVQSQPPNWCPGDHLPFPTSGHHSTIDCPLCLLHFTSFLLGRFISVHTFCNFLPLKKFLELSCKLIFHLSEGKTSGNSCICGYSINHWLVHFKSLYCMVFEICLNKAVTKKKKGCIFCFSIFFLPLFSGSFFHSPTPQNSFSEDPVSLLNAVASCSPLSSPIFSF